MIVLNHYFQKYSQEINYVFCSYFIKIILNILSTLYIIKIKNQQKKYFLKDISHDSNKHIQ